jgi:LPXTG-motif cell wall-anchored protein
MASGYDIGASISPSVSQAPSLNSPFFVSGGLVTGGGQGTATNTNSVLYLLAGAAVALLVLLLLKRR